MARIKVIDYKHAEGRLKEIYDGLLDRRGKLADVHTIQSLRPESIVKHMELYMEIMFKHSDLSRAEREMIAVVVSAANQCTYCQMHHSAALNRYWKDEAKVAQLRLNFEELNLPGKEVLLCRFARSITLFPYKAENTDPTRPLKEVGLSDQAILDATLVVGYFNFVNRMVLTLGVELEEDNGSGYKY